MTPKQVVKIAVGLIAALFAIILVFGSFKTIPAGSRGVQLTLGKPNPQVLTEGLNFKIPFVQSIILMDVQVNRGEIKTSGASKDMQDVASNVVVNYHPVPESIPVLYQTIGVNYFIRVVDPVVRETVKAVTAKYTASELITKREEVKTAIFNQLKDRLAKNYVIIDDFSIVDFQFGRSFTEAIESKQTAEQLALKAQKDLERVKIEAEQKIAQAQAEAESLRLQKTNVTEELIRLREIEMQSKAIEKWDGKLPYYTGGAMPFINVGSTK